MPLPTILGHEILGEIQDLGPNDDLQDLRGESLAVGDRIVWGVVASCGSCFYCNHALPQKCERGFKYGHEAFSPGRELSGGLAEHCLLQPGTAILRVPDSLADAVATPVGCATATVAAALEAASPIADSTVLVVGAGMLGITACAMARARGAAAVLCCDPLSSRHQLAWQFGADVAVHPRDLPMQVTKFTGKHGCDIVLEMSGTLAGFDTSLSHLRTGGTAVLVGSVFPSSPAPLLLEQVVRRQWSLRGVHNYAPRHLLEAVDFLHSARTYPFDSLISVWCSLTDLPQRLPRDIQGVRCLRLGVMP